MAIWCGSTTQGLWCQVALNQDEYYTWYIHMTSFLLLGMLICHIPINYCSRKRTIEPRCCWWWSRFSCGLPKLHIKFWWSSSFIASCSSLELSFWIAWASMHLGMNWGWWFCRKFLRCLSKHGSKNQKRMKTKKKTWWYSTNACCEGVGPLETNVWATCMSKSVFIYSILYVHMYFESKYMIYTLRFLIHEICFCWYINIIYTQSDYIHMCVLICACFNFETVSIQIHTNTSLTWDVFCPKMSTFEAQDFMQLIRQHFNQYLGSCWWQYQGQDDSGRKYLLKKSPTNHLGLVEKEPYKYMG